MTPDQFASEYQAGYDRTVHYLHTFRLGHETTEDLAQRTWLNAWRFLDQFRGDSAFSTWVLNIARNVALMHLRRPAQKQVYTDSFDKVAVPSHESEISTRLDAASILKRTPAPAARLLRERFLEEEGHEQIAKRHGLHVNYAKTLIHRAKLQARAAAAR